MTDAYPDPKRTLGVALEQVTAQRDRLRDQLTAALEQGRAAQAQAQAERDQLLAQCDALTARLAWAEGELGKIWAALRDAR